MQAVGSDLLIVPFWQISQVITRASLTEGTCINQGGSIQGQVADEQMVRIIEAIQLPDAWLSVVAWTHLAFRPVRNRFFRMSILH